MRMYPRMHVWIGQVSGLMGFASAAFAKLNRPKGGMGKPANSGFRLTGRKPTPEFVVGLENGRSSSVRSTVLNVVSTFRTWGRPGPSRATSKKGAE